MESMNVKAEYDAPEDAREGEIIALAHRVRKIRAAVGDLQNDLEVTHTRLYGDRPQQTEQAGHRPCRSGCLGELQDAVDTLEDYVLGALKEEVARFRSL